MDLICEACGATNRPGSEFCGQCNAYLAWDRSAGATPSPAGPATVPVRRAATTAGAATVPATAVTGVTTTAPTVPVPVVPAVPAVEQTLPQPPVEQDGYASWVPVGESCPTCGLQNAPGRRFCAHCGFGFAASVPEQPAAASAAWDRSPAAEDRAARREYRRSLPPLYRWRRVLVGTVAGALVLGGVVWVRHPAAAAQDGWYALTRQYVDVSPLQASAGPAPLTVAGTDPSALVDRTERAWSQTWRPTGGTACGPASGTAEIVLTFAPIRVRQLQLLPGLPAADPRRPSQPQPSELGVTFPGRPCQLVRLPAGVAAPGAVAVDSGRPVTAVRIGVGAVSGTVDAASVVSITEVVLRSYPR